MKVVVTGGSGFVGAALVRRLTANGHDPIVVDNRPSALDVETRLVNIIDLDATKRALADADVVYHLAGPVLDRTRSDQFGSSQLQFTGTLNVVEAMKESAARKIVLASSFYVYDGLPAAGIVNESSTLNPAGMELFGAIKVAAEQLVLSYARRLGLDYVILRFGSAYGFGEGSNLVQSFLTAGLAGQMLEVWGPGHRMNQYTSVEDIADGAVRALDARDEIFNLISPEETSTGELATVLKSMFGFETTFLVEKPEGASFPYMSSRKAIRHLGWQPTPLADGLHRLMEDVTAGAS